MAADEVVDNSVAPLNLSSPISWRYPFNINFNSFNTSSVANKYIHKISNSHRLREQPFYQHL